MRRPGSTVALLVLVFMSFSLAHPAADLPETTYDESQGLFYQASSLISSLVPQAATSTAGVISATELVTLPIPPQIVVWSVQIGRLPQVPDVLPLLCLLLC